MSEQRYVTCPLCRNRIPVPAYGGRNYLYCSCGIRLDVSGPGVLGAGRAHLVLGLLALASLVLAVADLVRRFG